MSSLFQFLSITYALAWTCFIAAGATPAGVPELRGVLFLAGTFAPSIVAIFLTARADGRAGTELLLRRMWQWRVGWRWYIFAASYVAAVKLTVALLHRAATGAWPRFGTVPWYLMAAAVAISTPVQAGEELGWRGYALPRLWNRIGLASGSLLLGIIWATWHLPLFFIPATDTYAQSFPVYLLQVTALSVAAAWLYGNVRGRLLPVMLMHAAVNNTKDIVPSATSGGTSTFGLSASLVAWLTVMVLWLCAVYFLSKMRNMDPLGATVR